MVVDGPSSDHELVLKGRLMSQAPEIDPSVFLTECDPSSFRPGDFVEVEITGAREYDLIVRPCPERAEGALLSASKDML
jgi:ribosomal protein S12 methylthiotransferase